MFRQPFNGGPLESPPGKAPLSDLLPPSSSEQHSVQPSAPQVGHLLHLNRGEPSNKPPDGRSDLLIPRCYTCPLSGEIMKDPVILVESARTYDQASIMEWLEQGRPTDNMAVSSTIIGSVMDFVCLGNRHCPVSGTPLLHCSLIQNIALKDAISLWAQQNAVRLPSNSESETEIDYAVALLEDQLKAMYRGWDIHEDERGSQQEARPEDSSLEHLTRLLSSSDRATHQSAALSLARACWGCSKTQTIVGNSKQAVEGTLPRLVTLLGAEIEEGRPGHMGWALAELIRYHPKNQVDHHSLSFKFEGMIQMRLFRVRDVDVLGMLVSMLRSNDDQWVARGARIVGAWTSNNANIQSLMLESGIIFFLVDRLRTGSAIQKLHTGMALMHVTFQNRVTGMQALKDGALLTVPSLLNSRALVVRVVGAGIIHHLLGLFDYSWGTNLSIFKSLVDLLNQCEDYAGIVAASAVFELVHRDKIDLHRLTELPVLPRMLELLTTCIYPGFRRGLHQFLMQWANYIKTTHSLRRGTGKVCQEVIRSLIQAMSLHVAGINETAVGVIWVLLPLQQHYRLVIESLEKFEKLSMDATLNETGRSMCRDIVTYTRKVDMEHKTRVQVFFTTLGVCAVLKIIKMFK